MRLIGPGSGGAGGIKQEDRHIEDGVEDIHIGDGGHIRDMDTFSTIKLK
jgi:hypothetical protein